MPTDDDYGRREPLLLHQHSTSQFGATPLYPGSGSNPGNSNSPSITSIQSSTSNSSADVGALQSCYHKQPEPRILSSVCANHSYDPKCTIITSNSSPNNSNDRQISGNSGDYGGHKMDYEKSMDSQQQKLDDISRTVQSCCERYGIPSHQDRYNQSLSSTSTTNNHQYSGQQQAILQNDPPRYPQTLPNDQRLSSSTDRYSTEITSTTVSKSTTTGEYANTGVLALSTTSKLFSPESFPSPPSPAPANDCFIPPPPLSPSPNDKYASTQSLANYTPNDCIVPNSPNPRDRYGTAPASPMLKDRFSSSDRLMVSSAGSSHDTRDHHQRFSTSSERLLSTGSPVQIAHQRDGGGHFQTPSSIKDVNRYTMSTEKLVSSSPIHAPVPERFAGKSNDRFITDSPMHERYQRQESSALHHDKYSTLTTCERYLSSSPNPEGAHQRYASTERILSGASDTQQSRRYTSDRTGDCQKYSARGERCSNSSSPIPDARDYPCRYAGFQDVSSQSRYSLDRFNDLALQRYTQSSRSNDRFNERAYLSSSSPSTHDGRLASEPGRYPSASTERLLVSSSPSSSENSRYHSLYSTSAQPATDRFIQQSPTPDVSTIRNYQNQNSKNDKFIQVSKSVSSYDRYQLTNPDHYDRCNQERGYSMDRYNSSTNTIDRYQKNDQRYHGNIERYSPIRTMGDKYLSLPKPKDIFSTGRIGTSSSPVNTGNDPRNYSGGNASGVSYVPPHAHTPVERYVPQPPPEILYPDRYVDRYIPSAVHTPTDRYVPAADPGDPYMRRDLGFHHHYRLPPPGYPYHQTNFRFRGFAYASPGRISGSPGSSSSSSSTSAQREFSTSPLLRPKVRASTIEFTSSGRSSHTCCDGSNGQKNCCQVRRSLPPPLPSIPSNQSAHSSWQQSPSSGTTGTSTISSSGADGESSQSIGMYAVGNTNSVTTTDKPITTVPTISPSVPSATNAASTAISTSSLAITRSVSAPAGPRPTVEPCNSSSSAGCVGQKPRLKRHMSRTEAIKNYIKKETATFFGVDEETESLERQRWLDRRRRMASRKYGALLPEHKPVDPDITKDIPDSTEIPENITLRRWQQPVRRKDSVARMTLSGLHYVVETLTRQRPQERSEPQPESRSFPPSVISSFPPTDGITSDNDEHNAVGDEEEEAFFQRPPAPPPPPPPPLPSATPHQQSQVSLESGIGDALKNEDMSRTEADHIDSGSRTVESTSGGGEFARFASPKKEGPCIEAPDPRRVRSIAKDHYTSRSGQSGRIDGEATSQQQDESVILRRDITGGTRISSSTIDRVFDNSNRRQYGMGIVGRFLGRRSFRKSIAHKPHVRKQLDDIEDHRPFFTYWITTVQILVMIISLICYGFGPVGFDIKHRSGLVLVTSLSLQQVDYQEPANFWIGPRAADLIHLGAKFAPCMRRDLKILKEIDVWRERERDTACCIRNDDSGCVQSSKADCSIRGMRSTLANTISTWKKWVPGDSGPGGRISGSVCGLDPKFCDAPASIAPYEWPDDITKWPICRKMNPFSQRFRSNNGHPPSNSNFPVGRYKDKMAEHMVCEVIGHPCCIGIHGMCRITTKEYCDFVHGYFHEEASLCSQVECLHDVCGMIPFLHPEWPDQFYRLFTTTFLHAGILHLAITLLVQYYLMRDLEKLTGSLRIALIYFTGALAGNLASAIFIPYRAEVGPAGAHFALLATLVVEVLNSWPMLRHPRRALSKLIMILAGLLILGILPWVDNYAHLFGFIFGFLAAYALMPFITFGHYDRRRKVILIWVCLAVILSLFALLIALFYNIPVYECEVCKLFNCIPFTRDFCASQNINFKREEPV
ncbi:inactive rhomboid protein 1 isoform X3 [Diachasmimorpha longicaudata]|uniref:inactive rhomboid protein 1 isoform X3 n=1 Tax=Diachasmimorpha longicaudata TaxID=58733 RepID=UPI0030B91B91